MTVEVTRDTDSIEATESTEKTADVTLHWFLPTSADSRSIVGGGHGAGPELGERFPDLDYLTQVARAAEYNGFESMLTPTGRWCQDAWITTAALLSVTERLKFLVALRPGLVGATLTAQQAQTYQEISGNRLLLNVVVGGEGTEQRAYGDHTTKAQRYAIADESLQVAHHLWTSPHPLDFAGEHMQVEGAALNRRPEVEPPVFFGGSSPEGIEVAAARADVYLTWGEPPEQVKEKLDRVRARAAEHGRELEFGIRLHVIARLTAEEAWDSARGLIDSLDPERVAAAQTGLAKSQSGGSVGCRNFTIVVASLRRGRTPGLSRCPRTCGRVSAWCVGERGPPWSVLTRRSRHGSRSTGRSA